MATIKIDRFCGIMPRQHPSKLADGMAVTAHNVKLKNGKLVPLRQPSPVRDIPIRLENGLGNVGDARSLHIWRQDDGNIEMLAFPGDTWLAEGNIADDDRHRVVISGDTGVSFRRKDGTLVEDSPQIYLKNAKGERIVHPMCKNPMTRPKVKRSGDPPPELDEANKRYTYFFYTWVDEYGYESPVSRSSLAWDAVKSDYVDSDIEYNDGDTISFAALSAYEIPEGATAIRIYKVITGTSEGRIQFIAEFSTAEAVTEMLVTVKDEDAGEILTEIEAPPSDIRNIIRVFGGGSFYAGFSPTNGKTVCFSEMDLLYSWPLAYRYDVDANIVALATTSNTVYALTDGYPYVFSGTAPESMVCYPLAGPAACVSAKSVCVYRNAVFFASNEGICTVSNSADAGTVVRNLTEQIWTKDQWNALNPSSCIIVQHDGTLHCWFDTDEGPKSYSVDLLESECAVTTNDEPSTCACVDAKTDKLYFVRA